MMEQSISYLTRGQIDSASWDRCIERSSNGLIYAYSFYLDKMSKNWDALVKGNYEMVMPLTWNRKWGISYLYQPAFTASLGIFGNKTADELTTAFINAIPKKFKLVEIDFNNQNNLKLSDGVIQRINYTLNLHKSYDELYSGYRDNVKRNIKKAIQYKCSFKTDVPVEKVVELSKQQMQSISNLTDKDYTSFIDLFYLLQKKGQAISCGVYSDKNDLIASAVFFFSHNRAYYILVGNHPNGKTLGASHYLIDRFIHEHSDNNLILDFEGSDIRNLAFFYSSFGAQAETYPGLRVNRLPWWANLYKKYSS